MTPSLRWMRPGLVPVVAVLCAGLVACSSGDGPSGTSSTSTLPAGLGADQLVSTRFTAVNGVDAGAASGKSLNVPKGWTAQVWADVPDARMAVWTPDGRLIVSTGKGGSLSIVTPGGGDRGPRVAQLASGLSDPQGVAMTRQGGRDILVVGENSRITTWTYANGAISDRRVVIDNLPTGGHDSKMVAVDGDRIVYNVGSTANRSVADRTATPVRATIAQIGFDGTGNTTLAVGVRNGEGLSVAPDGTVFTAINEDDNQPYPFRDGDRFGTAVRSYINDHPNDQISRITPGTDMGWPLCVPDSRGKADLRDLGYVNDPQFNADGRALDCSRIGTTMLGLPAHSAPVGFVFTRGSRLPASLADGAIVTAHGSWNRQPPREPYVAYTPWDSATRSLGPARLVATGFQNSAGKRWGRSVDSIPGPDGSLYVTDDTAGLVYRLTPGR